MEIYLKNFILSLIISSIIIPASIHIWSKKGPQESNYLDEKIPIGAGIILIIPVFLSIIFVNPLKEIFYFFFINIFILSIVGLIDDLYGDTNIKGLKGHFGALLHEGKITSGILKVFAGAFAAFTTAFLNSNSISQFIINFFLVLFFINALNLFDLRPGRCLKAFFLLFFIAFLGIKGFNIESNLSYLFSMVAASLIFFIYDIKAAAMLGDAGSNILGYTIGYTFINVFPLYLKILFVLGLILLHWFTEKYSLTEVIENNNFLRFIDNLGRKKVRGVKK